MLKQSITAHQAAYQYIKAKIQNGTFPGGYRLKAEILADEIGISRMPVREAILQLHSEGLVIARPNRGAVVTSLTADQVSELIEMRAVLEGLAAKVAIQNMDDEAFDKLKFRLKLLRNSKGDVNKWLEKHDQFHELISEYSGRPHLIAEIDKLRSSTHPYLRVGISKLDKRGFSAAVKDHKAIVDALLSKDPDGIEAVMRDHIISTADEVLSILDDTTD